MKTCRGCWWCCAVSDHRGATSRIAGECENDYSHNKDQTVMLDSDSCEHWSPRIWTED